MSTLMSTFFLTIYLLWSTHWWIFGSKHSDLQLGSVLSFFLVAWTRLAPLVVLLQVGFAPEWSLVIWLSVRILSWTCLSSVASSTVLYCRSWLFIFHFLSGRKKESGSGLSWGFRVIQHTLSSSLELKGWGAGGVVMVQGHFFTNYYESFLLPSLSNDDLFRFNTWYMPLLSVGGSLKGRGPREWWASLKWRPVSNLLYALV